MTVTARALINSRYAQSTTTTEYASPANTRTIIDKFTVTNTDSGSQTISIYLVPETLTASAANIIISAKSIAAGATVDLTELKNQVLESADFVAIVVSVASKLVIRMSGRAVS